LQNIRGSEISATEEIKAAFRQRSNTEYPLADLQTVLLLLNLKHPWHLEKYALLKGQQAQYLPSIG